MLSSKTFGIINSHKIIAMFSKSIAIFKINREISDKLNPSYF